MRVLLGVNLSDRMSGGVVFKYIWFIDIIRAHTQKIEVPCSQNLMTPTERAPRRSPSSSFDMHINYLSILIRLEHDYRA